MENQLTKFAKLNCGKPSRNSRDYCDTAKNVRLRECFGATVYARRCAASEDWR